MGVLASYLPSRRVEKKPIKNPLERLLNIAIHNFRGILGVVFFVVVCIVNFKNETRSANNVAILWTTMFFFLFIQPVRVPVMGIMPVFFLPFTGVIPSNDVCGCYFGAGIAFFIIGGWLILLLNNSGLDRRLILWILCPSKDTNLYSTVLLIRCAVAAFLLSALSNRLLVTSAILQYITKPLINLHGSTSRSRATEPNYNTLRFILCNAVQTSSVFGGLVFPHSSFGIMGLRAIVPSGDYLYNFLDYCFFAVPASICLLIGNLIFHIILIKLCLKAGMSAGSMATIRNELMSAKSQLPKKITVHEILTIEALTAVLVSYFLRYGINWKLLGLETGLFPSFSVNDATDATIASFYAIIFHIIPKSFGFLKYFHPKTKKRNQLPPLKPESTILFWKFVDKNTNYAYFLLMGSSVALIKAVEESKIDLTILTSQLTAQSHNVVMLILCVTSVFLGNIMSCIGVIVCYLPLLVSLRNEKDWVHIGCMAVAMGAQFGFCCPFLYTPSYLVKQYGKVPLLKQVKFGVGSAIISCAILWVLLCFFAPAIFTLGLSGYKKEEVTTTTVAP